MAFTSLDKVRGITNLSVTDISDATLNLCILRAYREICKKINVQVIRERIEYIDNVRQNDMDGVNTTFYIKNYSKFIADKNKDGNIDGYDIDVYVVIDDVETKYTVSTVSGSDGKFVLSSPIPGNATIAYVSYEYSKYSQDGSDADSLLEGANTYLASAYAYLNRDVGSSGQVKFGNTTINRKLSENFGMFQDLYLDTIKGLNSSVGGYKEGAIKI